MPERQLDVFARSGIDAASAKTTGVQWRHVAASERDDHVLIPTLPTLWAEDGSPQPGLNGRCRLGQPTFAGHPPRGETRRRTNPLTREGSTSRSVRFWRGDAR